MAPSQQEQFAARLARLGVEKPASAAAATENILAPTETRRSKFEVSDDSLRGRLAYPVSVVWSFLFGILSIFVARFAMAHMAGAPDGNEPMTQYLVDIGVAAAIIFAVKIAIGTADKARSMASTVGLFLAISTMHNLFWLYPDFLSLIYGDEWVNALLRRSAPSSIYFRGEYIIVD